MVVNSDIDREAAFKKEVIERWEIRYCYVWAEVLFAEGSCFRSSVSDFVTNGASVGAQPLKAGGAEASKVV